MRETPLFADVPKKLHRQLASWADRIDVPAGTTLIREDGAAREFFVILSGTAEVTRAGEHVATLGPGDFFGEVGLLGPGWQRSATVVATSPMELVVVAPNEFRNLMDIPAIAEPVREAAAARAPAGSGATARAR